MHLKTIKSLALWSRLSGRSKVKHLRPGDDTSSRNIEPRLVLVREKVPSHLDMDTDVVYGVPCMAKHDVQFPAPDNNGLFLPMDVLGVVLSFTAAEQLPQCATVCRNWKVVAKLTVQLNLREARGLLKEGLTIMSTTNTPTQSVKLFSKALDLSPNLAEASFWKAKGLFILNDESSAIECLQEALTLQPPTVERLKLLACLCYAQSNDLKASQFLEVALQRAPADASVHFELGFCYHGLQQFARAVECYTHALDLKYERSFVLFANRANCYFRLGKVSNCLQDLEASLQISPNYDLALRTRAFVNVQLGNPEKAYQDYTAIIERSGSPKAVSDAYCNRAFCYGEMDEADMERARVADPSNPEPVRYKASVLLNHGSVSEAVDHMSSWIKANPAHKELGFQLAFRAELLAAMNDFAGAIADYKDAIHGLMRTPVSLNNAGSSVADTLATYQERLRDLVHEQRRATPQSGR